MATYTVDELKDFTSIPSVSNFSDAKILLYQTMAEAVLTSLSLNTSKAGYLPAYQTAVLILFDMLAENPTCLSSMTEGKVEKDFILDDFPMILKTLLTPYREDSSGVLTGVPFARNDIGLR
jgi:hypothetical protein